MEGVELNFMKEGDDGNLEFMDEIQFLSKATKGYAGRSQ